MKKYIIHGLLAIFVLFAASCRKTDNPRIPTLQRVPVPFILADATKSPSIDVLNPTSFSQAFTFAPYFTTDIPPKQMDLVAIKNGDKSTVKTLQAGFTTVPATANVTGTQLVALFGAIKLGDNFTFGLDITTQDGAVYQAFPALGVGYGSGVLGEYNGSTNTTPLAAGAGVVYQLNFGAICKYDPSIYQGTFIVVQDDWADTNPGDLILLTQIDATHFSFNYNPTNHAGTLLNAVPIIVTVNPLTNTPSVALQTVGTGWTYDKSQPVKVVSTTGANNSLLPCAKTVSLNLTWTQGTGSFAGNVFSLKKQ